MTSHHDDLFDIEALKEASRAATPAPDATRRQENLRLAQENFIRLQGSRDEARLTSERSPRGVITGVRTMLNALTSRAGLTITTAVAAFAFVLVTPVGQDLMQRAPGLLGAGKTAPPEQISTTPPQVPVAELEANAPLESGAAIGGEAAPEANTPGTLPEADTAELAPAAPEPAPPVARGRTELDNADAQAATEGESDEGHAAELAPVPEIRSLAAPIAAPSTVAPSPAVPSSTAPMPAPADGVVAMGGIAQEQAIADPAPMQMEENTEAFSNEAPNPVKITVEEPVSTFSIDVDTASWAMVRSSIMSGYLPPPDSVRVEEMINYFPYDYAAPEADDAAPFRPNVAVFQTPWNADTQLVRIGLQGEMPALADRPPLNLVFLIDTSGSMADADKLPLLKQSFRLMLDQLRPEDQVAIVEYAGSAGLALAPTAAGERGTILNALGRLGAGGSTNGQGGLEQAYAVAQSMMEDGEVTRVLLATDGDFNVGLSGTEELTSYIEKKRESGVYLSVLGFGRGNLDDATMQALAQNGNGIAAYIDTLSEAQKVLVDQLTGALFPIAGDVKVQVEFNPAVVAEYRLIGYETRALRREDFNNDQVDAGELGAGHSVTAIYEITPVGSPAVLNTPLRYQDETVAASSDEIGFLRLRWKAPGESVSQLMETPINQGLAPDTEARFAAAIAGFGQLLRGSDYMGAWSIKDAVELAAANRGADEFGYRNEAVQLMRLAASLSH